MRIAAGGLKLEPQLADAENTQIESRERRRLNDARGDAEPRQQAGLRCAVQHEKYEPLGKARDLRSPRTKRPMARAQRGCLDLDQCSKAQRKAADTLSPGKRIQSEEIVAANRLMERGLDRGYRAETLGRM